MYGNAELNTVCYICENKSKLKFAEINKRCVWVIEIRVRIELCWKRRRSLHQPAKLVALVDVRVFICTDNLIDGSLMKRACVLCVS